MLLGFVPSCQALRCLVLYLRHWRQLVPAGTVQPPIRIVVCRCAICGGDCRTDGYVHGATALADCFRCQRCWSVQTPPHLPAAYALGARRACAQRFASTLPPMRCGRGPPAAMRSTSWIVNRVFAVAALPFVLGAAYASYRTLYFKYAAAQAPGTVIEVAGAPPALVVEYATVRRGAAPQPSDDPEYRAGEVKVWRTESAGSDFYAEMQRLCDHRDR